MDLIVLLLYYLYDNHSLVDVSQFAILKNIGKLSDTALIKKFIQCKDWIQWLIVRMIPNEIIHYKKPKELEPYHVIAVDASDIIQKGTVKKHGTYIMVLICFP